MEQFFKHPQTLSRLREGPLGPYLDAFTQQSDTPGKAGGLMSRTASKAVDLAT
jgi:hypothetical protein